MKGVFSAVEKALKDKPVSVQMTAPWKEMHANWGVGQKGAKQTLNLSPEDFDLMRQRAIQNFGADPLGLDREKDRTALSEDTANEKLTHQRAFGRLIRVAVPGHGILLGPPPGTAEHPFLLPTPPGVMLSVEPDQLMLETEKIHRVLVIENGQIMERWWDVVPLLPEAWRINTLIAYRGHRSDLRSLIEWIKMHHEDIELGFYGDFDPYGVRIGLRSYAPLVPAGRFTLIGPQNPEAIPSKANKPDTFSAHDHCLRFLERRVPVDSGARPLVEAIRDGRWAVTQESLLVHGLPLAEYRP